MGSHIGKASWFLANFLESHIASHFLPSFLPFSFNNLHKYWFVCLLEKKTNQEKRQ